MQQSASSDNGEDPLSGFFSYLTTSAQGWKSRPSYTDEEIENIRSRLTYYRPQWSGVPRTYIVLRTIDKLDLLDSLLETEFSDHWFPVTPLSLPGHVDPNTRANFIDAQRLVLTQSVDLEKGSNGRHQYFQSDDLVIFQSKGVLGTGAFGEVDKVLSRVSFREYARKRIPRKAIFNQMNRQQLKEFLRELEVMKKLEHKHIVKFIGSYTDPQFFGLLISPIAEMDLSVYLDEEIAPRSLSKLSTIRSFFGCLATALAYLHKCRIRHKDIKSKNILVKGNQVLLTDFGLSRDALEEIGSTTSGPTRFTRRYCAPEVAASLERSYSADIWSLGCVYLEMVAVLKNYTVMAVYKFYENNGTRERFPWANSEATDGVLNLFRDMSPARDHPPLTWIEQMLRLKRHDRPTAIAIMSMILDVHRDPQAEFGYCGICCTEGDEGGVDRVDEVDDLLKDIPEFGDGINPSHPTFEADSNSDGVPVLPSSAVRSVPASNYLPYSRRPNLRAVGQRSREDQYQGQIDPPGGHARSPNPLHRSQPPSEHGPSREFFQSNGVHPKEDLYRREDGDIMGDFRDGQVQALQEDLDRGRSKRTIKLNDTHGWENLQDEDVSTSTESLRSLKTQGRSRSNPSKDTHIRDVSDRTQAGEPRLRKDTNPSRNQRHSKSPQPVPKIDTTSSEESETETLSQQIGSESSSDGGAWYQGTRPKIRRKRKSSAKEDEAMANLKHDMMLREIHDQRMRTRDLRFSKGRTTVPLAGHQNVVMEQMDSRARPRYPQSDSYPRRPLEGRRATSMIYDTFEFHGELHLDMRKTIHYGLFATPFPNLASDKQYVNIERLKSQECELYSRIFDSWEGSMPSLLFCKRYNRFLKLRLGTKSIYCLSGLLDHELEPIMDLLKDVPPRGTPAEVFCILMHLIHVQVSGCPLPTILPISLQPPLPYMVGQKFKIGYSIPLITPLSRRWGTPAAH